MLLHTVLCMRAGYIAHRIFTCCGYRTARRLDKRQTRFHASAFSRAIHAAACLYIFGSLCSAALPARARISPRCTALPRALSTDYAGVGREMPLRRARALSARRAFVLVGE